MKEQQLNHLKLNQNNIAMKFLIVGLGNPGSEYINTRHNIGFKVVDAFVDASNTSFRPDRLGHVSEFRIKNKQLVLLKPNTYMNLSGKAVNYWMQKEKISIDRLLVVTDDLSLPTGKLRLKAKGSDGGHNGLKSIQETLGTSNYPRLRFGIGRNFFPGEQVNYVLGEWEKIEAEIVKEKITIAIECMKSHCLQGLASTMNHYNNK